VDLITLNAGHVHDLGVLYRYQGKMDGDVSASMASSENALVLTVLRRERIIFNWLYHSYERQGLDIAVSRGSLEPRAVMQSL